MEKVSKQNPQKIGDSSQKKRQVNSTPDKRGGGGQINEIKKK